MNLPLPKGYVCYRTPEPLPINGRLDHPSWLRAPWTDDFIDIEGEVKPLPHYRTRAKMLWDESYFYIGAELEEPHVWGTLTEHDSVIFQDNDFEVFIDPDGDNHNYYEFEINSLNTGWDLLLKKPYRDGGPALNEWEIPGLKTAVHVEGTLNDPTDLDRGWSVEIAFPWEVLAEYAGCPSPPSDGDPWRVNFSRVQWQHEIVGDRYHKILGIPEDNWVWSPQGVIDMHRPERWGYVQFSTADVSQKEVAYEPNPIHPLRDALMKIYYRQKTFFSTHGRWASSLEELSPEGLVNSTLPSGIELCPTPGGYNASTEFVDADGSTQRWHIEQDSRIWRS